MKWHSLAVLLFFFLSVFSCSSRTKPALSPKVASDSLMEKIEFLEKKLEEGDLVLRLGNDITSNMLSQLNLNDKRFSHIGICFVENGQKLVYHSVGGEGEIGGSFLRKEPIAAFFDTANNISFGVAKTNFTKAERERLELVVKQWYDQKIPFDLSFDLKTDDSLYCSEMVAKAIHRSNEKFLIPTTDTLGYNYFGVDNITQAQFVDTIYSYSRKQP